LAIAAARAGSVSCAVTVISVLSERASAKTRFPSSAGVVPRCSVSITRVSAGHVVATAAYVVDRRCDTINWLKSGFSASSDCPTISVARAS
jgi:hypothetical protein